MTNPIIAKKNRRRAACWPVFKLGIAMEVPCRLLVGLRAMRRFLRSRMSMIQTKLEIHWQRAALTCEVRTPTRLVRLEQIHWDRGVISFRAVSARGLSDMGLIPIGWRRLCLPGRETAVKAGFSRRKPQSRVT